MHSTQNCRVSEASQIRGLDTPGHIQDPRGGRHHRRTPGHSRPAECHRGLRADGHACLHRLLGHRRDRRIHGCPSAQVCSPGMRASPAVKRTASGPDRRLLVPLEPIKCSSCVSVKPKCHSTGKRTICSHGGMPGTGIHQHELRRLARVARGIRVRDHRADVVTDDVAHVDADALKASKLRVAESLSR